MSNQLSSSTSFTPVNTLKKALPITVGNADLQSLQWRAAFATIVIPFIGTIFAVNLLPFWGVSLVDLGLFVSMYALTFIGITVGFHRYFAHNSFETKPFMRVLFVILGSMAAQGPVINWVATHRRHHQYSDLPEDPHSPYIFEGEQLGWLHGFWHSHIGWMLNSKITNSIRFAKDLLQDSVIVKLNRLYLVWVGLGLAIPAILGGLLTESWSGLLTGFLWGGLVRLFLVHQFSWTIGSFAHIWGKQPFETKDQSRNNIWLAIPNFGEAWHNNHHAFITSAVFGLKWWQIDLGAWVIRTLERVSLVWDVKRPSERIMDSRRKSSIT